MKKYFSIPLLCCVALIASSCHSAPKERGVLTPGGFSSSAGWTREEKEVAIARRLLKTTPESSHFLIRLLTLEEPHVHQDHDLVVTVLKGEAEVTMGGKTYPVAKGDLIDIPRGTPHAVKNAGRGACEVYALFTPAFEGKDHHPVESA